MKSRWIWEHNGQDTLLYSEEWIGAYVRGDTLEAALKKTDEEIAAYQRWADVLSEAAGEIQIVQEKASDLQICDADSDVLFDSERSVMEMDEYLRMKRLVLKSASDFNSLYESIPDKDRSCLPARKTFYGSVPRTAREMYEHTKGVNSYYFAEIGVEADNDGDILECRKRGFEMLERQKDFLIQPPIEGSYGEEWSLRKVMRRFIWHDRIHARAMYRMAVRTFGRDLIADIFRFTE